LFWSGSSYKRPTCPKKVRVITGRRARRKAIAVSSLSLATLAVWAQVVHPPCVSSVSIFTSSIRVYVCFLPGPPQAVLKRGLRKKKRAVDVDVFTRFSLLNNSIIAQKKRKVNPAPFPLRILLW
jgi:hypothetical protein